MKHLFLLIMFASCSNPSTPQKAKNYQLENDGGIFVEKFDSTYTYDKRYTENNLTYTVGKKFTYDYYYESKDGVRYKFEPDQKAFNHDYPGDSRKAWHFVTLDTLTETAVAKLILTVKHGLKPFNDNPDYNQTIIGYSIPNSFGNSQMRSSTGVIENEKNIWLHPPRMLLFTILELNPFPFIQAPYKVGNSWEWSLKIGSGWGDQRWRTWEGIITNSYNYQITDHLNIATKAGNFECFKIVSKVISSIGNTYLTSYFNKDQGFVKLDYTNIDSSRLILELTHHELVNSTEQ